jgi:aryl-alcohol dehydrogenase-like predicted oxidoreductase
MVPPGGLSRDTIANRGVLSGKYKADAPPPEGSRAAVQNRRMMQTEYKPEVIDAAASLARHAAARGVDPIAFAIAWVLANPIVTGAIAGPRTMEQWRTYLKALDVQWTADDEAAVNGIVPAGATAVPRFVDPLYPVEGRPAR